MPSILLPAKQARFMLPLVGRASQDQCVLFPDAAAGKVEACIRECPAAAVTAETPWAASPIPFERLFPHSGQNRFAQDSRNRERACFLSMSSMHISCPQKCPSPWKQRTSGHEKSSGGSCSSTACKSYQFFKQIRILRGFSHDMYVSGDAAQRPPTPGYQFRGNQRKRERRSSAETSFSILTSPLAFREHDIIMIII